MTVGKTTIIGAAVAVIATAIMLSDEIGARIGWPPYASAYRVADLEDQIAAASDAVLWIRLENAMQSGDRKAIIRACNALIAAGYSKPAGCP